MHLLELCQQIFRDMWARKLRSILALFGIVWGTVAVVLLLALGQGFYQASKNNMRGFVDGTLIFGHGTTSIPYDGLPPGRSIHIKAADGIRLQKIFPKQIKALSPVLINEAHISRKKKFVVSDIQGISGQYQQLSKLQVQAGGRFINPLDINDDSNVIIIGPGIKNMLFPHSNPINQFVELKTVPFRVVGVLKNLPHTGKWYQNMTYIPYTTAIKLWGNMDVMQISVLPSNINKAAELKQAITNWLAAKFHFSPNDKSAIWVFNTQKIYEFFHWFFTSIEIFLGFCGAMTLGVGGVGIANVMFLIVTERTSEIGLRMALGARDFHIMLQILLEAAVIVALGGLIGFLISGFMILLLQHIPLPQWLGKPIFSFPVLLATLCILAITAILAGYFPARRAAKMQPVAALAF